LSDWLHTVIPLTKVIERVAALFEIELHSLKRHRRTRPVVEARDVICYFAVREVGHSGAEVARGLNMTRSAVSIAAGHGEKLVWSNRSLRDRLEFI